MTHRRNTAGSFPASENHLSSQLEDFSFECTYPSNDGNPEQRRHSSPTEPSYQDRALTRDPSEFEVPVSTQGVAQPEYRRYSFDGNDVGSPEARSGASASHIDGERRPSGAASDAFSDLNVEVGSHNGSDRSRTPSTARIPHGNPPSPDSSFYTQTADATRYSDGSSAKDIEEEQPYTRFAADGSSHRRERTKKYLEKWYETFNPHGRHYERWNDGGHAPGSSRYRRT